MKETIEIPLLKATWEELQEVICELQVERYVKDKEIERLHSIIKEVREYIENKKEKQYGFNYEYELNENEIKELLQIIDKENKE